MRDRVEELRKAVEAAEQNRQAAMRALAEERQRSLELQVKISRQVLKNSMFFRCTRRNRLKHVHLCLIDIRYVYNIRDLALQWCSSSFHA